MKKISAAILFITIFSSLFVAVSSASGNSFTDVPSNTWYYNDVNKAVEKGLIHGKTSTTYAPEDNLTYAEAIKLASCIYKLATEGNTEFEVGFPWYMPFVNYAKSNNIISKDYKWETKTTRAEYLEIFSNALPAENLGEVNSVPDNGIPDVPMTHPSSKAIYKMYRAGIVQGSDEQYNCKPNDCITRAEVAAILTRMMDVNSRRNFTITIPEYRKLYNTGYAPYDAKINEYYQAMNADENDFYGRDDSSINGLMVGYARGYEGKIAYSLYDVNGNGVPELVFSDTNNIIDIYTLNNGLLIKIFPDCYFGERSRLHILSDGSLLSEGSSGASTSSCEIYTLNSNGTLTTIEAYYYNSNGPDAYMKGYTYISTNEYVDKINNYLTHSTFKTLKWNVFADMKSITQNDDKTTKLLLTEEMKEYLTECCYRIPDFNQNTVKTEEFVSDFIYYYYTAKEYERAVWNDDTYARVPWDVDVVRDQYKLLFGYDMPKYNPGEVDVLEYKGLIYKEGKYYVAPSDFGEVEYTFDRTIETADGIDVIFNRGFSYDCVGYVEEYFYGTTKITLKKADNKNGFIITSIASMDADGKLKSLSN